MNHYSVNKSIFNLFQLGHFFTIVFNKKNLIYLIIKKLVFFKIPFFTHY